MLGLWFAGLLVLALVLAVACNLWVVASAGPYIYRNLHELPNNDVGLLLGTSPYTKAGKRNILFRQRISAAEELYREGKVKHLLVSGANPDETYNEPRKMYQALGERGIPAEAITMDFAGFRTLDSIVRAREIFRQDQFTVISQQFHNYRAIFIARQNGLNAVAYIAPGAVSGQNFRVLLREYLARVIAVLDLFVLRTQPRFLGRQLDIELDAEQEKADSEDEETAEDPKR